MRMRVAAVLMCLGAVAMADGMGIGAKAPPIDISHWVKGEAVTEFRPGHVYVLEFWATW